MKILIAGDTHMEAQHLRYLIDVARTNNCTNVFVLGDFGYWEHVGEGVIFLDRLNEYAEKWNVPVYFLDGNHDKTSLILERYDNEEHTDEQGFLQVRPFVRYSPRGHRWSWDGCSFITLGGAYSVDKDDRLRWEKRHSKKPGTSWFPEEEMSDDDMVAILAQDMSPVDVILAHDKPLCAKPDWDRKSLEECIPNQLRLQLAVQTLMPKFFFHGHLHYRYDQEADYGDIEGRRLTVRVTGLGPDPTAAESRASVMERRNQSWIRFDTTQITGSSYE